MANVLSILIPTLATRRSQFALVLSELQRQAKGRPVEILSFEDDGEITTGSKRQSLLEDSTGRHICYVDDDDSLAPDYVDSLLSALKSDPDCVGFNVRRLIDGVHVGLALHSLRFDRWNDFGALKLRTPNHLNPIRRELALTVGFPDFFFSEDYTYSMNVRPLLKTEVYIQRVLYIYQYVSDKYPVTAEN